MRIVKYSAGQRIVKKGELGTTFFLIKSGTCKVTNTGQIGDDDGHELTEGAYFGERALLTLEPRAADVYALTQATLLCLDSAIFTAVLGPLHEVMDSHFNIKSLSTVGVLKMLTKAELKQLNGHTETVRYKGGDTIFVEGDTIKDMYVSVRGDASIR